MKREDRHIALMGERVPRMVEEVMLELGSKERWRIYLGQRKVN